MSTQQVYKCSTITFLLLILLFFGCTNEDPSINFAALINGKPITRTELANEMSRIDQRFNKNSIMSPQQITQIEREILDILIGGELLYQESQKSGILIDQTEVKEEVAKANKNSANKFTDTEIAKKLYIEKYIFQEFSKKTHISDDTAKGYYQKNIDDFTRPEQVLTAHILIKSKKSDQEETQGAARVKLEKILTKIKNGADFSQMAKEYSQDSSSQNGGLIGYIMRGQMPSDFENAVFALDPGQVSDIVKTDFGFHIIQASQKKPMEVLPFADVKSKLKSFLKEQEIQKKIDQFLQEKRKQSTIQVFLKQ